MAYSGMEKYFPPDKIVMSGNPVRQDIKDLEAKRKEALAYFQINDGHFTLLIIGGSLGAKTINHSIKAALLLFAQHNIQLIWQTGKAFYAEATELTKSYSGVKVYDFISRMDYAYAACDAVVSRAGAISLAELCIAAKPAVLVPSPNVAEDHQTKNANSLVAKNAALVIRDEEAVSLLANKVMEVVNNAQLRDSLSKNIKALAISDAAQRIAKENNSIVRKMRFDSLKYVYLIGIGGIGMSGLARYFKSLGKLVNGYDKTPSSLTQEMEQEGIEIHYEDDISLMNPEIINHPSDTLIIYTPAIPSDHSELNYFVNNKYNLHKRAEVLGWITEGHFTVAVAGTHGKTTTSTLVAHILRSSGNECMAFLGGVSKNYHTNILLNKTGNENKVMVVEADEYDRSFLTLNPDIAIITSVDPDHLDIYQDKAHIEESYSMFANRIHAEGCLVTKQKVQSIISYKGKAHMYSLDKGY